MSESVNANTSSLRTANSHLCHRFNAREQLCFWNTVDFIEQQETLSFKSLHALEKYTELKSTWIDLTLE